MRDAQEDGRVRIEDRDHDDHHRQCNQRVDRLTEDGAQRVDGVRDRALADVRLRSP